ncbi:retron-type reverse transcriptase [Moorella thermoacetica Y72]|uniref:Retron-type reverse transcriptase n=1 Tax=Moorella thermoacetica Y72 TaxID=1325331 RepID=A0A0S6U6U2_NEOTH|nr:group II intron reverse transcriptase/maturase [Moorella thermoacetica]GAF24855.1 retron-type reverse transcriptase [Moorella thermoacetica Y72]
MTTKLARIAEVSRTRPKERFTSLMHLIAADMLRICHVELKANRATGVDGITKEQYGDNLEANIQSLLERLKRKSYRPQPVRRVYIPKPGSDKKRPLGIPAYEDKIVQLAASKILNAIYEAEFSDMSFGFRPQRGCHDALKLLNYLIVARKVNYIVDADIKGFFDHVNHDWLMRFLEHRIADPNFLRLIRRFLKAGIMENGELRDATEGTPQGGIVSPILANIYLHYVLDLWFEKAVRKHCRGEAYMVRYADDFICCFQYKHEAEAFYQALRARLAKFSLSVAEEKTKIIPFGRFATQWCKRMGQNKTDTFDFLDFTHYCNTSH